MLTALTMHNFRDVACWSLLLVVVDAVGSSSAPRPLEKMKKMKLEIDHNAELLRREKPDAAAASDQASTPDDIAASSEEAFKQLSDQLHLELQDQKLGGDKDKRAYQNLLPDPITDGYPPLPPDHSPTKAPTDDHLSDEERMDKAVKEVTRHSPVKDALPDGPRRQKDAEWLFGEVERNIIDAEIAAGLDPASFIKTSTTTTTLEEDDQLENILWGAIIVILVVVAIGCSSGYLALNQEKFGFGGGDDDHGEENIAAEDTSYTDLIPDSDNEDKQVAENPNPTAEMASDDSSDE